MKRRRTIGGDLHANLTPMIDVTFLLIVFFVLVSRIVDVESADLELPSPEDPVSQPAGDELRAVVNVEPGMDGRAQLYRLGAFSYQPTPDGLEQLTERLTTMFSRNPSLRVNVRADRRTEYEWIEPVLGAVSAASRQSGHSDGRARINLVVVRERT